MAFFILQLNFTTMALKNAYPEKPVVPYKKTTVEMAEVISDIQKALIPTEVKRMSYIMFRNEGANGKSGICYNFCGFQADGGRWDKKFDPLIMGIVKKVENGTGRERLFLAFKDVNGCLTMLFDRVQGRGLYIGGTTHKVWENHYVKDVYDLSVAYQREWVKGNATALPTFAEGASFRSMYKQAAVLFK